MKVNVYLETAGQEALANGTKPQYWSYSVRYCEGESWETAPGKGAKLIAAEVPVVYPDKALCTQQVIAHLREEQQRIYTEAAAAVKELKEREENLLALTYSTQIEVL